MRRAFTLIEIIIYLAIVGMIAVSLVMYSISVSSSRSKAEVVAEVQTNTRFALDIMRQKIRSADRIDFINSTLTNPGKLYLVMPTPTLAQSPVIFDIDNGRLRMKVGTGQYALLTSDEIEVANLQFANLTKGAREHVSVSMTLRYKNAGSVEYKYEYSITSAIGVRI